MIRTILVPAIGSSSDDAVFTSALTLARVSEAHLSFLHIRVNAAAMAATMAADGSGATMIAGLVDRIEEEAKQREERAKQRFERFCERERLVVSASPGFQPGPSAEWLGEIGEEGYWIAEYARAADLLVLGRPADDGNIALDTVEKALLASGRPVLMVPAAPLTALPETMIVAWKAAPEAARAVTAGMPLLSRAKQILIVTVAEEEGISDEEGARLMTGLRWHGLNVSTRHLRPDRHGAAETLLAFAREQGALVIMGAYGHSRLREWVFGGFTQHVLRDADVPVLMMH
jgi:nucleotide-binding universal stress UspA family protein